MKHTQGYLSAQCKYFDIYFPYEHDITYMEDIENAPPDPDPKRRLTEKDKIWARRHLDKLSKHPPLDPLIIKLQQHKPHPLDHASILDRKIRMVRSIYTEHIRDIPLTKYFAIDILTKLFSEPLAFLKNIPDYFSGFGEITAHAMNPAQPPEKIKVTQETPNPLLLVHGDASNAGCWMSLGQSLHNAQLEPVFTVQLPGRRSGRAARTGALIDKIQTIVERYDTSEHELTIDLIAHSFGVNTIAIALEEFYNLNYEKYEDFLKTTNFKHCYYIGLCEPIYIDQGVRSESHDRIERFQARANRLRYFSPMNREPITYHHISGRYDLFTGDFAAWTPYDNLSPWNPEDDITVDCGHIGILHDQKAHQALIHKLKKARILSPSDT